MRPRWDVRSACGALAALLVLSGCARPNATHAETPPPNIPPPVETPATKTRAPPSPPPDAGTTSAEPGELLELSVPGFEDAFVSFPSRPHAPLLVAAHGAGNTPDELCETLRALLGDRGVILCPAGPKMDVRAEGRYFPDHFALERIVLSTLAVLENAYPNAVDTKQAVYAGYSQGATMGALMIVAHGDLFPRLLLIEGGTHDWSFARASEFRSGGARRVLFCCGTRSCAEHAETSARVLTSAGVEARAAFSAAGHTYKGPVADSVRANFDWLVRDDPRWGAGR